MEYRHGGTETGLKTEKAEQAVWIMDTVKNTKK